jgi:hypothetical protein
LFSYCNGYHQYFPTIEAVAKGGYGADRTVSPAEVGAGERMMDRALIAILEMAGRINGGGTGGPRRSCERHRPGRPLTDGLPRAVAE